MNINNGKNQLKHLRAPSSTYTHRQTSSQYHHLSENMEFRRCSDGGCAEDTSSEGHPNIHGR